MNERDMLKRIRDGWTPLWLQVGSVGKRLEKRGYIKADYAPDDHKDAGKLICILTERGRGALNQDPKRIGE